MSSPTPENSGIIREEASATGGLAGIKDFRAFGRLFPYLRPLTIYLVIAFFAAIGAGLIHPLMVTLATPVVKIIFEGASEEIKLPGEVKSANSQIKEFKDRIKEFFLGPILRLVQEKARRAPLQMVFIVAGTLVGLAVLRGLLAYVQEYYSNYVCSRVILDLQTDLFRKMLNLSMGFFSSRPTGRLMSVVVNDVDLFGGSIRSLFGPMMVEPINFLFLLTAAIIYGPVLTPFVLIVLGPTLFLVNIFGKRVRKARRKRQERLADVTAVLQESFSSIRIVKAFSMEEYERERFYRQAYRAFKQILKVFRVRALAGPVVEVLGTCAIAAIIIVGGFLVLGPTPTMDPEDFISCVVLLGLLYQPVKKLDRAYGDIQQGLAGADRVFRIFDEPPLITDHPDAVEVEAVGQGIRFEDVSFSYDGVVDALSHITFEAKSGETIALVGHSGAGKTTFVDLLARFYDVTSGRISINGVDVRQIQLNSLRKLIGIVPQEVILFNDTVARNIAYGRPESTSEQIEQAARDANAHEFIKSLPQGYETLVGERGTQLSGGQAQRIAIARALLKNPPILILDEATSALDSETESLIRQAIERLVRHRTTFVIAHRLSTIMRADDILVFDHGVLSAHGTHAELLANSPVYQRLYRMQFDNEGGL